MILYYEPEIGMGATVQLWSDRHACTIVQITHGGKRLVIQQDDNQQVPDPNRPGQTILQYSPNPTGQLYYVTKRKDGTFRLMKSKTRVFIGTRNEYYDPSF
jgi:hypothetical protein